MGMASLLLGLEVAARAEVDVGTDKAAEDGALEMGFVAL